MGNVPTTYWTLNTVCPKCTNDSFRVPRFVTIYLTHTLHLILFLFFSKFINSFLSSFPVLPFLKSFIPVCKYL